MEVEVVKRTLEFKKHEFFITYNVLPVLQTPSLLFSLPFSPVTQLFRYLFFRYLFPRDPEKERKKRNSKPQLLTAKMVDCVRQTVWVLCYASSLFFSISVSTAFSILYLLFIYLFLFWVSLQVKLSTLLDSNEFVIQR